MEIYKILAWVNVALAVLNVSLFLFRRVYKKLRKVLNERKSEKFLSFMKATKKIHPISGFLLILTGFIHGYMALGGFYFHTGTLIWIITLLMPLSVLLKKTGIGKWVVVHRFLDILIWFFLIVHRLNPWLIY